MSAGKVVIGLVAGLATGALLGILFAPDKGYKTRKRIYREGEKITEDVTEKFMDFMESVTDKFNDVKKDVTDFAEKVKATEKKVEKDLKADKV
jgi:gas vesicle protein